MTDPTVFRQYVERPPTAHVLGHRQFLALGNAVVSLVLLSTTAVLYDFKRGDQGWVGRVPYDVRQTHLLRTDLPTQDVLDAVRPPSVIAPPLDRGSVMMKALAERINCTETLFSEGFESPRCNCVLRKYRDSMGFPDLDASKALKRFETFRTRAAVCMDERGAFKVKEASKAPTVMFDVILVWWGVSTLTYLFMTQSLLNPGFARRVLRVTLLLTALLLFYVFYRSTESYLWYLLVLFATPVVVFSTLLTLTHLSRRRRGGAAESEQRALMFVFHEVFGLYGTEGMLLLPTMVGVACAHRVLLLAHGRNDVDENAVTRAFCVFVGGASFIVRILHNSMSDLRKNMTVCNRRYDYSTTRAKVTMPDNADKDPNGHPKSWRLVNVESTLQSLAFAGMWTWGSMIIVTSVLMWGYAGEPPVASVAWVSYRAKVAFGLWGVMFLLQIPLRHTVLGFASDQQLGLFHIIEFLARFSAMLILWGSLLG